MTERRKYYGRTFAYQEFMENEGLPIHQAVVGVDDVTALPRAPWARTGGLATFVELRGTYQAQRGVYVGEIPGGAALEPERHLYEEEVFILQGRGVTQVWQGDREKITFEWGPGSVFAYPRCTTHRLFNGGSEPVIYLAVTTAPAIMNTVDDLDLVFNCDSPYAPLYDGERYFQASDLKTTEGRNEGVIWHTNFIPDCTRALVDDAEYKVAGGQLTGYRMGNRFPQGHISEWPSGRYHKAHYHEPGAILLGLDGEGYVLAWDHRLGPHPYQDGRGDQVAKVNWRRNSIYSPPDGYYHQHFNTGAGPARHIAVYGNPMPMTVHGMFQDDTFIGSISSTEGGTLIEYADEDPQIRRDYEAAVARNGVACTMPAVQYR
jgi:mannose-6-phosphate isomerase-like protein (cupin superfamily)